MSVVNTMMTILQSMYQSEMWAYRAHGDGDIEVLGSVVLLEGVDVEPDLKTQTMDSTKLQSESNLSMETKHMGV